MTDTDTTSQPDSETAQATDAADRDRSATDDRTADGSTTTDGTGGFGGKREMTEYLYWGAFATLLLLALLATVRFYLSASRAISIWIASEYVPVFQAAFNLAVVLACAVGLSVLVRRMRL